MEIFNTNKWCFLSFFFNIFSYYIAKSIKRGHCSDQQLAELQRRVDALIAARVEIKAETLEKLRALGIAVK